MKEIRVAACALGVALVLGCAATNPKAPEAGPLAISAVELPDPGMCRFWTPEKSTLWAGDPFPCAEYEQQKAPAGAFMIRRLSEDRVAQVEMLKSGAIGETRLYDVKSGKYLGK